MKIIGLGASFPDRVVTNTDILKMIEEKSKAVFNGDLNASLQKIDYLFDRSGLKQRHWLGVNETSFDHIKKSIDISIEEANINLNQIDLLIYASIDRQVREPGQSILIAKAMNMLHVQCFDIVEACAGWTRATHIAQAFLNQGIYENILIVTAEFNCHEESWARHNYKINSEEDLSWSFSAFTIGEGASATILTNDKENEWHYDFKTLPKYSDLCMAPISDSNSPKNNTMGTVSLQGKGKSKFVSYSYDMNGIGVPIMRSLMQKNIKSIEQADLVIPHNHSKKIFEGLAQDLKSDLPYFFTYPEYGNLVTGSIPSALFLSKNNEILKQGDQVVVLMTAAGFSFSVYSFRY